VRSANRAAAKAEKDRSFEEREQSVSKKKKKGMFLISNALQP
jgi:hypothetical protein